MKKILLLLLTLSTIALGGENTLQIPTKVTGRLYNNLTAEFMAMPTFLQTRQGDRDGMLELRMNSLGGANDQWVGFSKKYANDYQQAIEKYFAWAILAKQRKDYFIKDIATCKVATGVRTIFRFNSAQDGKCYLQLILGSSGMLGVIEANEGITLDENSVIELKGHLSSWPVQTTSKSRDLYK